MLYRIKDSIRTFIDWKRIVWNSDNDFNVSFVKKLKYALKGFSANEYMWFDLEKNNYKEYISEFERLKSRRINGAYKFILDDKLVFEEVFSGYTRIPRNYAWINNGVIYGLHGYDISNDNVIEFLQSKGIKLVLKWNDRGGGGGTYVIESREESIWINEEKWNNSEVKKLFNRSGSAILCEYATQSAFSASLYPHTTNTIRIVCAKKCNQSRAQIIMAAHRIGCKASIPVDNVHSGGLVCNIDLDSGELSEGVALLGESQNRLKPFEKHPDTGSQIKGKVVPGWSELKEEIVDLTNKIPYLNFVAWDVLLTPTGFSIIEGNASSSCDMFQLNGGMRNTELGEIYRSYKIIK